MNPFRRLPDLWKFEIVDAVNHYILTVVLATGTDALLAVDRTLELAHVRIWVYGPKEDCLILTAFVSTRHNSLMY